MICANEKPNTEFWYLHFSPSLNKFCLVENYPTPVTVNQDPARSVLQFCWFLVLEHHFYFCHILTAHKLVHIACILSLSYYRVFFSYYHLAPIVIPSYLFPSLQITLDTFWILIFLYLHSVSLCFQASLWNSIKSVIKSLRKSVMQLSKSHNDHHQVQLRTY